MGPHQEENLLSISQNALDSWHNSGLEVILIKGQQSRLGCKDAAGFDSNKYYSKGGSCNMVSLFTLTNCIPGHS